MVKFTEGAWVIVIIFPALVFLLIRLNREYRMEAEVLENIGAGARPGIPPRQPNYSRRVVLIFVDDVDLATLRRDQVRARPAAHHAARRPLRHRQRQGAAGCTRNGSGSGRTSRLR